MDPTLPPPPSFLAALPPRLALRRALILRKYVLLPLRGALGLYASPPQAIAAAALLAGGQGSNQNIALARATAPIPRVPMAQLRFLAGGSSSSARELRRALRPRALVAVVEAILREAQLLEETRGGARLGLMLRNGSSSSAEGEGEDRPAEDLDVDEEESESEGEGGGGGEAGTGRSAAAAALPSTARRPISSSDSLSGELPGGSSSSSAGFRPVAAAQRSLSSTSRAALNRSRMALPIASSPRTSQQALAQAQALAELESYALSPTMNLPAMRIAAYSPVAASVVGSPDSARGGAASRAGPMLRAAVRSASAAALSKGAGVSSPGAGAASSYSARAAGAAAAAAAGAGSGGGFESLRSQSLTPGASSATSQGSLAGGSSRGSGAVSPPLHLRIGEILAIPTASSSNSRSSSAAADAALPGVGMAFNPQQMRGGVQQFSSLFGMGGRQGGVAAAAAAAAPGLAGASRGARGAPGLLQSKLRGAASSVLAGGYAGQGRGVGVGAQQQQAAAATAAAAAVKPFKSANVFAPGGYARSVASTPALPTSLFKKK